MNTASTPHTYANIMRALLIGLLRDEARREQEDVRDKDQVGRAPAGAGLACEEGVGVRAELENQAQRRRVTRARRVQQSGLRLQICLRASCRRLEWVHASQTTTRVISQRELDHVKC